MFYKTIIPVVLTGIIALFTSVATAHVTLENPQTPAGSYYKAVLRVPHGCAGSATVKLRVRIPEGVIAVKPQPKPGWALETIQGNYAKTYTLHGARLDSGVKEIAWSGGLLPDQHFDEFAFMAYVADDLAAGTRLPIPVVQECETGVARWIDLDAQSDTPAPALHILPKT